MTIKGKIYGTATAIVLVTAGCKPTFLDLAPVSQLNANNFYKTEEDIKTALTATYGALQYPGLYYSSMHVIGDLRSDDTWIPNPNAGANLQEVDEFKNNSFNTISSTTWSAHYQGIQSANIVVGRIGNISMDESVKARLTGEAKFLRALMYFNLVRIFGDVPLVLEIIGNPSEGYSYKRESAEKVYAAIIQDLTEAESVLPEKYGAGDLGRATKGAATALLGKVYLTRKDWALAARKLKALIDQGTYQLLPQYADVFGIANENNRESIFEVQFKKGSSGEGSPFTNQFAPIGSGTVITGVGNPLGQNIPTDALAAAYDSSDLRKGVSMQNSYVLNGSTVKHNYVAKYLGVPAANLDSDNNWIVLRYADVLLMYAEALNELGYAPDAEAFAYLNQIRKRAGLAPKTSTHTDSSLRVSSQAAFRLAIEQERRLELAFEGHRWFDLIRTGRATTLLGPLGMQTHHALFPIPDSQIEINPALMTQNPGYN